MSNGVLEFSVGMKDAGFSRTIAASMQSLNGLRNKTEVMKKAIARNSPLTTAEIEEIFKP
jgi:hypothetical protein